MRNLFFALAALSFVTVSASTAAQAAASDLDDCILDITFQCLEDEDFWGCYDDGVELCENQSSEIKVKPTRVVDQILAKAKQRAGKMYKQSKPRK
jgi:ABC-type uncharacterized transport system YnjBCD substrate-binding protein